jgi:hypothetical protein
LIRVGATLALLLLAARPGHVRRLLSLLLLTPLLLRLPQRG